MALLTCIDCDGKVSSSAMTCVHCGNLLQIEKPGFLGSAVRILYWIFTAALAVIAILAMKNAGPYDSSFVLIPLVAFGIWFVVSIGLAVLLYVTRHGSIVRVEGAVHQQPAAPTTGWTRVGTA